MTEQTGMAPRKAPRYHISKKLGKAVACGAQYKCPLMPEDEHYDSREEAEAAYALKMERKLFPSFKRGEIDVEPLPKGMRIDDNTVVIPKGVYAVCDPSITISEDYESWQQWVKTIADEPGGFSRGAVGATYNGFPVIGLTVSEGNGSYQDNFGRQFDVASGLFGVVPMSLLKKMKISDDTIFETGSIVVFDKPTELRYEGTMLSLGDNLQLYVDEKVDDLDYSDEELQELELQEDLEAEMAALPAQAEDNSWPITRLEVEYDWTQRDPARESPEEMPR